MFSSTTSINSMANISSSYHHFPSLFSGYDTNNVILNYQLDPLTGHVLLSANPRIAESRTSMDALAETAAMTREDIESLNADYYVPSNFVSSKRTAARKDRHSKICTAQGLRDRRVRLSIEIAREFFGLQDMLGFDKASQTLEWLLIKSRKAIKEVAQLKHNGNGGAGYLYSDSQCGVVTENCEMEMEGTISKTKPSVEEKKMEKLHKDSFQLVAKESRDKARARARQRTKEKMCSRRLNEWKKGTDTSTQILTQLRSLSQVKVCVESSSYAHNTASTSKAAVHHDAEEPSCRALTDLDVTEESIELRRKLNSSSILAHQRNLGMSKDVNCNTTSNSNYSLTENWDVSSAFPHSTFRAITDMNLSAGLQIYGKTWEACNSQCQH